MPYFAHRPSKTEPPPFPPATPISDDLAHLPAAKEKDVHTPAQRRAYFADRAHRKQVTFGPDVRRPHLLSESLDADKRARMC